ncbi:restriction endonuclease [Enterobacter hormaechei subsp. hoffmannii]|uniref:Restriction endonuclease n=1 Tax=Enterobacter asburiae TaxID=61645 RepID=A0A8I1KDH1_ENTAS|nr:MULTISPECIES: restriction endonuclease [Enterobacteriaceae]MCU3194646.1 restriction endonuclease [Enterobacter hormaechei subsp. hoffmannii]MDT7152584.1 restriction endonuclease [Citrobacter freundii]UTA18735.1 restriction endonuclease [Enterobacter cloacae]HBS6707003.1 restriction endonuclease [Klebsiella pneumoniae]MBJ6483689.1 restriction endonuclease [Enterobacter hormaechei]
MTTVVFILLAFISLTAFWLRCNTRSARVRRHQRNRQTANRVLLKLPELKAGQQVLYLRKINPYVFEEMVLTAIERRGIPVRRNPSYSGDGGIDGQFWIGQERWLVQAKRFASAVRPEHVRQFGELVRQEKCRGLFVHTGRTGFISFKYFSDYPEILLISGSSLLLLLSGESVEHVLRPLKKRQYR